MSKHKKKKALRLELIKQWESSGLSQKQFCEQQGLSYRQFAYWRGLENRSKITQSEPKLLKVVATLTQPPTPIAPESTLEVLLPTGVKLYLKNEIDINLASALIQRLGDAR